MTPSFIGIVNLDKTIDGLYCDWDGHPENQLPILVNFYKDKNKIRKLINLRSISLLGEEIGYNKEKTAVTDKWTIPSQKDDRFIISNYESIDVLLKHVWEDLNVEYVYIYDDNIWKFSDCISKKLIVP